MKDWACESDEAMPLYAPQLFCMGLALPFSSRMCLVVVRHVIVVCYVPHSRLAAKAKFFASSLLLMIVRVLSKIMASFWRPGDSGASFCRKLIVRLSTCIRSTSETRDSSHEFHVAARTRQVLN